MEISKINDDYFIDTDGNVYSRPRKGVTGGILHPRVDFYGYYTVRVTLNGKKTTKAVHRLLAEVFIPNPNALPTVNHKDGNKLNNALSNLEWCSYGENNSHAWRTGLRSGVAASGERYVYVDKQTNRFRVIVNGPQGKKNLGRFVTLKEAINARDSYSTAA